MRPPKFNQTQIKAVTNLLLELGKWLLITIVFGTILLQQIDKINSKENVVIALVIALLLIIYAIWLLKEVKDK